MTPRRVIADLTGWDRMRAAFDWPQPDHYNIAGPCCDDWALPEPDRLAIRHVAEDGAVRDWCYGALKCASDGLAQSFLWRNVRKC